MNNCAKILIIYILRKCGDKKFTYLTHFNANEENYNKKILHHNKLINLQKIRFFFDDIKKSSIFAPAFGSHHVIKREQSENL